MDKLGLTHPPVGAVSNRTESREIWSFCVSPTNIETQRSQAYGGPYAWLFLRLGEKVIPFSKDYMALTDRLKDPQDCTGDQQPMLQKNSFIEAFSISNGIS